MAQHSNAQASNRSSWTQWSDCQFFIEHSRKSICWRSWHNWSNLRIQINQSFLQPCTLQGQKRFWYDLLFWHDQNLRRTKKKNPLYNPNLIKLQIPVAWAWATIAEPYDVVVLISVLHFPSVLQWFPTMNSYFKNWWVLVFQFKL